MDYRYEFERLLMMAEQVVNAVDFDNKKVLTFAELAGLRNAVTFYKDQHINKCICSRCSGGVDIESYCHDEECNCINGIPQTSGGCPVHGVRY